MQIWDAASDATITFGKADLSENLAFIVENDLILDALTVEAETTLKDRIDIMYGSKITNYVLPEAEDVAAQVTLDNGSQLTADLIVCEKISYNYFLKHLKGLLWQNFYVMHTFDYHCVFFLMDDPFGKGSLRKRARSESSCF